MCHLRDFWSLSLELLPYRPLRTLQASYWWLTRRRVRAGNVLRDAAAGTPLPYRRWLKAREGDLPTLTAQIAALDRTASFTVLIHGDDDSPPDHWRSARRSVQAQAYPHSVARECTSDALALTLRDLTTDYVFLLRAGDRLSPTALPRMALSVSQRPAAIVFADEDRPARHGRTMPWFKPAWNKEMFLALDFLSGAVALRRDIAAAVAADLGGDHPAPADALLLRAADFAGEDVTHLPHVLVHRGSVDPAPGQRLSEVARFLGSSATCLDGPFGTVRVQWPLPEPRPLVSIVIPTRDQVELLRTCLTSIFSATSYDPFEIVIVDNGSCADATLAYFADLAERPDVRIVRSDAPFNFSALSNLGARAGCGEYVLFLNNDTEVIGRDWLAEMMRYAVRPEVGAVGAKLLYSDRSIQHAGVVVGMGDAAGHPHRFLADADPGYFRQPHVAQFMSAVTAACLLVSRRKFEAVGGFDEQVFAVAYNDVDLCLRLQQAGWRNVYTPHALLFHHESKSRGSDLSPANRERYMRELSALQGRWATRTCRDPLHSPNLHRYSETYLPSTGIGDSE